MITIHIIAGPHCALKTTYFNRAFCDSLHLSAEKLYNQFAAEALSPDFEAIWINTVTKAVNVVFRDSSIVLDGATLDNKHLAYDFSSTDSVNRFIELMRAASPKPLHFIIHWLELPLFLREIFNRRRAAPYTPEQLKSYVYWGIAAPASDVTVKINHIDDILSNQLLKNFYK